MSERLSLMRFICAGAGAFRVRFRFISVLTLYKTEELFMTGKNRIIYGSKKKRIQIFIGIVVKYGNLCSILQGNCGIENDFMTKCI